MTSETISETFTLVGTLLSLSLPSLEMVKNDLNHVRDDVFSNMIMPVEPLRSANIKIKIKQQKMLFLIVL